MGKERSHHESYSRDHSVIEMKRLSFGAAQDGTTEEAIYLDFLRNIDNGNLEAMKEFLDSHPEALTGEILRDDELPLNKAVLSGDLKIVEEIVRRIQDPKILKAKNNGQFTALLYAAAIGIVRIAECLVTNCSDLVGIGNRKDQIPVVLASLYGHKDMVRYLYSVTPSRYLDPYGSMGQKNGPMLVTNCIFLELYDIALELIQKYPKLAYEEDSDGDTAIFVLAQTPSAFRSGTNLSSWQCWIYSWIPIDRSDEVLIHNKDMKPRGDWTFKEKLLQVFLPVPIIEQMKELKLRHHRAEEILKRICEEVEKFEDIKQKEKCLSKALFKAVENGIIEMVEAMMSHEPDAIWFKDECHRNIFFWAVYQRREKIWSRILKMRGKKDILAHGYNDMHQKHKEEFLSPPPWLGNIPGAAFQMQREIRWFKEVENYMQPAPGKMEERMSETELELCEKEHGHLKEQDEEVMKKTALDLFTEKHEPLRKQGEEWMKNTAESCSFVATIIATVIFAAAFTVPGGYDNKNGIPSASSNKYFTIFMISDALSLFTSCLSLLLFLGILKSKYLVEDFFWTLPRKLICGMTFLLLSMATMMVAFSAGIVVIMFDDEKVPLWAWSTIVVFAAFPTGTLYNLVAGLLLDILLSTFGFRDIGKRRA